MKDLLTAKDWSQWIEDLSRSYWEKTQKSQWTENLSRSYQADKELKNLFDGSRSCRDSIEKKPKNLDGSRICRWSIKKRERRLDRKRIHRGFVEKLSSLKRMNFSREEKSIKMNATSKLLNQGSKQHIKLSKHLSTHMQSIHRSKNAHTH